MGNTLMKLFTGATLLSYAAGAAGADRSWADTYLARGDDLKGLLRGYEHLDRDEKGLDAYEDTSMRRKLREFLGLEKDALLPEKLDDPTIWDKIAEAGTEKNRMKRQRQNYEGKKRLFMHHAQNHPEGFVRRSVRNKVARSDHAELYNEAQEARREYKENEGKPVSLGRINQVMGENQRRYAYEKAYDEAVISRQIPQQFRTAVDAGTMKKSEVIELLQQQQIDQLYDKFVRQGKIDDFYVDMVNSGLVSKIDVMREEKLL